jgi:hypothetical protein
MEDINNLTLFMGWCSIINIGLLLFSSVGLIVLRGRVLNIHSKITGISQAELLPMYFRLLGNYKIAIIIFNLVPYIVLKIMW